MSKRFPASTMRSTPVVPSRASAPGVWTMEQQYQAEAQDSWPLDAGAGDQYFPHVGLLLNGNGTNGANNSTFVDQSSNNLAMTRTGNPLQGSNNPFGDEWSAFFDGTSDYIAANNAAFAVGTGDFTIEGWFNVANATTAMGIVGTTSTGWAVVANAAGGLGKVTFDGYTPGNVLSSNSFTPGVWNHFACVRRNGAVTVYLNGVGNTTGTNTFNYTATDIAIGRTNANTTSSPLTGFISNIRLVKSAVYTADFTPPTAPLTAITNTVLLVCNKRNWKDSSTTNADFTIYSNAAVVPHGPFKPTTAYDPLLNGGSAYFDSTDMLATTNTSSAFIPGTTSTPFTVECWAYGIDTATNWYAVLSTENFAWTLGFGGAVGIYDGNRTPWFGYYAAGWQGVRSTTPIKNNCWVHLAAVFTGSTCYLYQDGVLTASGGPTSWGMAATTSKLRVGARPDLANYFTGYISGARVVIGSNLYPGGTTFTPSANPPTAVTNTQFLMNFINGGIYDGSAQVDLETTGSAQISTAVSKWGGGSISLPGSSSLWANLVRYPQLTLGVVDFTIEFWMNANSVTGTQNLVDMRYSGNGVFPTIYMSGTQLRYFVSSTDRITGGTLATGTWYHIAVCRSNGSTRMFINGEQVGSTYADSNNYVATTVRVGSDYVPGSYFNGYIDDLRITRGIARYTGNFIPPISQFSAY